MKTTSLFAGLIVAAFATSAFAQSPSGLSRAEVKAEAVQAAQSGEVVGNLGYPAQQSFGSGETRSDVRNETLAAQKSIHVSSALHYPQTVQSGPGKTRAEVPAEFVQAKSLGQLQNELN